MRIQARPFCVVAAVLVLALFLVTAPLPAQDYRAVGDRIFFTPRAGVVATGASAAEGPTPGPAPTNVLEDCWTTDISADPDPELESYSFTTDQAVTFIWKQKLLVPCSSYTVKIIGTECTDGKPPLFGATRTFQFNDIAFGPISPIPGVPEPLLSFTTAPGSIPPGRHDWLILAECDDTTGFVRPDGDFDDVCGLNKGFAAGGPLILGPEPIQFGDPDPGGVPPGRGPGEEGTTRPWCFDMVDASACVPGSCGTFTACSGASCFCFELADSPGTGSCLSDNACGTACPGGTADCGAGEVCITNTCCGYDNCIPAQCSAGPDPLFSEPFTEGSRRTQTGRAQR